LVLRGSYTARIDEKGRLKLPTAFKTLVEQQHGSSLYVTSLDGASVLIYPMPVWLGVEERLSRMAATHPTRNRFLDRVNFYGQPNEFDAQGRVVIQPRLRESAGMVGEVSVIGKVDFLEVWNFDRLKAKLDREPFTDDDARILAEYGV
jgi:MraZ protein